MVSKSDVESYLASGDYNGFGTQGLVRVGAKDKIEYYSGDQLQFISFPDKNSLASQILPGPTMTEAFGLAQIGVGSEDGEIDFFAFRPSKDMLSISNDILNLQKQLFSL